MDHLGFGNSHLAAEMAEAERVELPRPEGHHGFQDR